MSSTQIQLESDRVVSVQTQSITALSSVRKGTIRKLEGKKTVSTIKLFQKSVAEMKNESQTQKLEKVFL